MKAICKNTREHLTEYIKGSLKPQDHEAIAEHLKSCAGCREFAYSQQFPVLMQEAFGDNPPEPSKHYFSMIRQKLAKSAAVREPGFSEVLAHLYWKLVPTLALLLVLITASLSYVYTRTQAPSGTLSLEDMVIYEENSLTEQTLLDAIISEENNHGK